MKLAPFMMLIVFAAVVIYIGYFMWSHRQRDFWLLTPTVTPGLSKVLTYYGGFLIILGVATLIATLFQAALIAAFFMIIAAFAVAGLSLLMLLYSNF